MKLTSTIVPIATAFVVAVSAETCPNGQGGPYMGCGNENRATCCIQGQYCQPWNPGYYQCLYFPADCKEMLTDVDLYGDDLFSVFGLQPDKCAEKCQQTNGCVAFTFINNNPGSPACYLKRGYGQQREKKGAVSCKRESSHGDGCNTPAYGYCGSDSGTSCCPNGQYCQPWNSGYYQCINTPGRCSKQQTNVDFYGNDIRAVYGVQPDACCEECARTPGCRAYTFINNNPGSPACYLKSGEGEHRNKVGAVSGLVN